MSIVEQSIKELSQNIKSGALSVHDVVSAYINRSNTVNPKLNAMVAFNDNLLSEAKKMDDSTNKEGALFGIPLGIKDIFCTKGLSSTASSNILKNFIPPYTASCVEALENQGALVLGKTNMDEFAMGSSNESSAYGPCKNPWDIERVPGGSSGGSAAAVAANMVPATLGTDTGGSIRQPASFCGVVGIKPTYGSVSRYGMITFASSLDQAGPMGRTVDDCALLLDAMIFKDKKDATNVDRQVGSLNNLDFMELKGKRIGLPKQFFEFDIDSGIKKSFDATIKELESLGADVVEVSLPHTSSAVPVYYMVATSEVFSNLSRYDGVCYGLREAVDQEGLPVSDLKNFYSSTRSTGFGEEVQRRILLGTFALSSGYYDAYYIKACQVRRLISNDFKEAFKSCDWILSPVSTTTAFKIKEKINDPIAMYNNDIFTTSASLAGLPAMSMPIGLSAGLPVGLQIIAPAFSEDTMLSFAKTIEEVIFFKEVPGVR